MMEIAAIDKFHKARYLFFKWRHSLALINKITLALGMACLTGLAAQIKVSLPWTPVPMSGQTLAVLLAGILLGRWWGGISQAIYIILGMAGLPWLAGFSGGFGALAGPTGGYLLGFILAALFLGYFTDRYIKVRNFLPMLGLMLFANFILIHIPGLLQLGLWSYLVKGSGLTLRNLLWMGTVPFIIGDLIKIITAAALARAITPREAYNGEVDAKKVND
jgi:biotin transport system substrate-specific component